VLPLTHGASTCASAMKRASVRQNKLVQLEGKLKCSPKICIMQLMLNNYDSQKRFVLFWPHKTNKNIFINSGAIYQNVTGDRMRYVLAKWRPTSHSSAVRRLFINIGLLAYSRWICMIIIITSLLFISEFLVYQLDSQLNSQPYTK